MSGESVGLNVFVFLLVFGGLGMEDEDNRFEVLDDFHG